MNSNLSSQTFHAELIKEVFHEPLIDDDVFALMLVLHACKLILSDEAQVEGHIRGFEGITTRHAAEVVSSLFASGNRSNPAHWYLLWNTEWMAYAILESPPESLAPRLNYIRDMLESHDWIDHLENDDWDILPPQV